MSVSQEPYDYTLYIEIYSVQLACLRNVTGVSPAYGYIRSAPIKCSNDGGPGPRHTMKRDPGYSIFSMPVVYGYYLHPLTSSEKRVIGRISENPLPPFKPPWAEPRG